jgi:hypothetical protein
MDEPRIAKNTETRGKEEKKKERKRLWTSALVFFFSHVHVLRS